MPLADLPTVSIIIVNYNGADVILNCLASLYNHLEQLSYEIIVVDNNSQDGSPGCIAQRFPNVILLQQSTNLGFGTANNLGAHYAQGEMLFLLNSDTLLTANILPKLIAKLTQASHVGIVGPQLRNPDGTFQLSVAREIGIWGEFQTLQQVRRYRAPSARSVLAKLYAHDQRVDIVIGAAMLMRRSLFEQIGGFDETFFMYFEESDLCKRVRDLGYIILYTPEVSLIHRGGYSVAKVQGSMCEVYRCSQRYYYKKHRPAWECWLLNAYLALKAGSADVVSRVRAILA